MLFRSIKELHGANVVLGVHWLKSLGLVLTDYNTLAMKFFYEGKLITLQGDMDASLCSLSAFQRLSRTHNDALYYHITMLPDITSSPQELPSAINTLLHKFEALFQTPHTLPPPRVTDYRIHLLPYSFTFRCAF